MRFIVKSLLHINSVWSVVEDVVLLSTDTVASAFAGIVETVVVGIVDVLMAGTAIADADAAMAVVARGVSIAFIFSFEFTLSVGCICTPSTGGGGGGGTPAAGRLNDACAIFVPFVEVFASVGDGDAVVCADVSSSTALSETNEFDVCGTFDLLQY